MATKRIKTSEMQKMINTAVRAAIGKGMPKRPGSLAGFWVASREIAELDQTPAEIAAGVAEKLTADLGVEVKPKVVKKPGGILVGFIQPKLLLPR